MHCARSLFSSARKTRGYQSVSTRPGFLIPKLLTPHWTRYEIFTGTVFGGKHVVLLQAW